MYALRLTVATAIASVLTVFAVLGLVHFAEIVSNGRMPSPIAVSHSMLDFGEVPVHRVASQELIVRNDGGGPVHARFSVPGTTYSVEPEELILQPGIEWSVTVMASPDRRGPVDDELRIDVVGDRGVAALGIPLAAEGGPEVTWEGEDTDLNRV